jgi:hypothetical protein
LVRLKYISQEKAGNLTIVNPIPPRIYILIKLHKESMPGRPVAITIYLQSTKRELIKRKKRLFERLQKSVKDVVEVDFQSILSD